MRHKKGMLALLFMFAAPHAAHSSSLPDSSFVVADARDVVRDSASGTPAHSTSGECVRTQWINDHDVCRPMPMAARRAATLSREDRTVYFAFDEANLTPDMQARLDTLATVLESEKDVKGARIVGYADRIGDANYNDKLSKQRAETVQEYLIEKGLIHTHLADTRWVGSSRPSTNCPHMKKNQLIACLQNDRRVEVEIIYTPDIQASR